MLDNVASPAVRQKRSKLAPTSCQASSMFAAGTTAVNVVGIFTELLSFCGFGAPHLPAQGEQRLPLISTFSGATPHESEPGIFVVAWGF
jgi:hypothetical protein